MLAPGWFVQAGPCRLSATRMNTITMKPRHGMPRPACGPGLSSRLGIGGTATNRPSCSVPSVCPWRPRKPCSAPYRRRKRPISAMHDQGHNGRPRVHLSSAGRSMVREDEDGFREAVVLHRCRGGSGRLSWSKELRRSLAVAPMRLVIVAGLKLIVVPIDSTWMRHSFASGSRARASHASSARAGRSRQPPVEVGRFHAQVHQNGAGNSAVFVLQRALIWLFRSG